LKCRSTGVSRRTGARRATPSFSFASSVNITDATVHFPAPTRFDDGAGGKSIGYLGPGLALPVTFRISDPGSAAMLALKMDYAVCEKICVPASGSIMLPVRSGETASPRLAAQLAQALPTRQAIGAIQPISVLAMRKARTPGHFVVDAALPPGAVGDLFIEGSGPWLFDSKAAASSAPGKAHFEVLVIDRDTSPDCKGVEITLTLTAENRAVETTTWLDVSLISA
jgi:DsbC/DsbD-like thiol-disulfide interchange protein